MAVKTAEKDPKPSNFEYEYKSQYESDYKIHRDYIVSFDALEAMQQGEVYDEVSKSIKSSQITDSYTATLAIERAARVMGQLPDGVTTAPKGDQGKAAFMDILRQKWIFPNANSQLPFLRKMEVVQENSDVYGYMPVFIDWNVAPDGYVGPDCWLWNPRQLVFQQGKNFFADMEYVTALTWVTTATIDGLLDKTDAELKAAGWDRDALAELRDLADQESDMDQEKDTRTTRNRVGQSLKRGIQLATRYESGPDGEWRTFAPDHAFVEVRRLKNPHKNGRIPFRIKWCKELFDSPYGQSEFARSKPLQFARDGLTNFYFRGVKMNLVPPLVVNANGVLKHTVDYREGGVIMETIPNSVRSLATSSAGLSTYQGVQSALTGSLLALWGSQNASMPGAETLNPSQGKTPAAISLYNDKEDTRDGRARDRMEYFIEEITEAYYDLVANIGTEAIPVSLFSKDLEEIQASGLTDVTDLFQSFTPNSTFTGGELRIDPTKLRDLKFRFHVEPGSTAKINKQQQLQELDNYATFLSKFQNQFKDDPTISINWEVITKAYASLTNLPGADKFVKIDPNAQAPTPPPQATATMVQTPGGQVHESADLVKLFQIASGDKMLQDQIVQLLGFQPSPEMAPPPPEPITNKAGVFKNPTVGAMAEHVLGM